MASALLNNVGLVAPEGFLDLQTPPAAAYSYGWLSPRVSFSRDFDDDDKPVVPAAARSPEKQAAAASKCPSILPPAAKAAEDADLCPTGKDPVADFEFRRLDDPVVMLPADELFSEGKLVPLQMAPARPSSEAAAPLPPAASTVGILSPEQRDLGQGARVCGSDRYVVFSPKAPRCSSRWRELLRLKKAVQNDSDTKLDIQRPSSSSSASPAVAGGWRKSPSARSLKYFLSRNRKSSSIDSSLSLPLLRESDSESLSFCAARFSLSSCSSVPDHEDIPRLSLDSDRPSHISIALGRNPPRVRLTPKPSSGVDPSQLSAHPHQRSTPSSSGAAGGRTGRSPMRRVPEDDSVAIPARGASVDSPRMNSSGKVVFHGLERSSSSPSTFNGGPRAKHRGMERSYSANVVRVTPVLNVPVCSLRGSSKAGSVFGFGQLFSLPQKRDSASGSSSSGATRNGGVGGRSGRAERSQ